MRHAKVGRKLGRKTGPRRAMFRNLMTELFRHEKIKTTEAKAKAIQGESERILTLALDGSLHARRQIMREIGDKAIVDKLIHVLAPDLAGRPGAGGYTRIIKIGARAGDGAPMVFIELV
jgi:large subunit ribosomal protein L17